MLSEDGDNSGFSPFLWYKLGQSSAEASQVADQTADLVRRGFGPPQVVVDRDTAVAEVYRLDAELEKANESIRSWMSHAQSLERDLGQRNETIKQLRAEKDALKERLDLAMRCYDGVSTDSHERLLKIEALEALVEKLRKGEA